MIVNDENKNIIRYIAVWQIFYILTRVLLSGYKMVYLRYYFLQTNLVTFFAYVLLLIYLCYAIIFINKRFYFYKSLKFDKQRNKLYDALFVIIIIIFINNRATGFYLAIRENQYLKSFFDYVVFNFILILFVVNDVKKKGNG